MKPYIRLTPKKEKMPHSLGWAVWPFLAVREDVKDDAQILAHEEFHITQQLALGWVLFFPLWLIFNWYYTYDYNPFELASEAHALDPSKNNPFSWLKFL